MFQLGKNKICDFVKDKPGPRGPRGLQEAGERRREEGAPITCPWAMGCAQTSPCFGSSWLEWGWRSLFWLPWPQLSGKAGRGEGPVASSSSWQQLCTRAQCLSLWTLSEWELLGSSGPGPQRQPTQAARCRGLQILPDFFFLFHPIFLCLPPESLMLS